MPHLSSVLPGAPGRSTAQRDRRPSRVLVAVAPVVFLGLALAGLAYAAHGGTRPLTAGAAPVAAPSSDPRLVIRPRTVAVSGMLSGGVRLVGTLYPSYPGRNTLHLHAVRDGQEIVLSRPGTLVITMPGMAMRPIHAELLPHGRQIIGRVILPMFGAYRADIVLLTPRGHTAGNLLLTLNLPQI